MSSEIAEAIIESLQLGGACGERNFIESIDDLAHSARQIATSITPTDAYPGNDAAGGAVGSLTEAVMGITAGLVHVANAIEMLAKAVQEK